MIRVDDDRRDSIATITLDGGKVNVMSPDMRAELLRQRLTPAACVRAAMLADVFTPTDAVETGFLDQVVPPEALSQTARDVANRLSLLDAGAYSATKMRARVGLVAELCAAIDDDAADLADLAERS